MSESPEQPPPDGERDEPPPVHSGEQGTDEEAHGGIGAEESGPEGDAQAGPGGPPGIGGYGDRDPETEMPRMPTAPDSQGETSDVTEAEE